MATLFLTWVGKNILAGSHWLPHVHLLLITPREMCKKRDKDTKIMEGTVIMPGTVTAGGNTLF